MDRNSFINSAAASVIGIVVGSEPVWADEEVPGDLSMPSPEEQKAKEVSAIDLLELAVTFRLKKEIKFVWIHLTLFLLSVVGELL